MQAHSQKASHAVPARALQQASHAAIRKNKLDSIQEDKTRPRSGFFMDKISFPLNSEIRLIEPSPLSYSTIQKPTTARSPHGRLQGVRMDEQGVRMDDR